MASFQKLKMDKRAKPHGGPGPGPATAGGELGETSDGVNPPLEALAFFPLLVFTHYYHIVCYHSLLFIVLFVLFQLIEARTRPCDRRGELGETSDGGNPPLEALAFQAVVIDGMKRIFPLLVFTSFYYHYDYDYDYGYYYYYHSLLLIVLFVLF